jgi:nucleotide-binding universal stress UspA family protein
MCTAIAAVTGVLVPHAADTADNDNAGTFSLVLQNDVFYHCQREPKARLSNGVETMDDIQRILIVSRLTAHCRKAVHVGISIARKYDVSLYVMHVLHNPVGLEVWNLPPVEREYVIMLRKSKEDIDAAINADRTKGMEITEIIKEGEPTTAILEAINAKRIDFLVMLAHEEDRFEHFLFGRSNEELVRRMLCSVILVKIEPTLYGEVD